MLIYYVKGETSNKYIYIGTLIWEKKYFYLINVYCIYYIILNVNVYIEFLLYF